MASMGSQQWCTGPPWIDLRANYMGTSYIYYICFSILYLSSNKISDGNVHGVLRSAVGMTHSLRSDLWWAIPFRFYLVNFEIPLGSHTIKPALARHTGVQVSLVPAKVITWSYPTCGCPWVVLWLLFFRSAPSTFPDTRSTFKGPFRGVPSR